MPDPKDERPARWPPLDAEGMLFRLTVAGVDFVVIGGIAMVLHGSARLTRDLDIVFAPDRANLDALGKVLIDLGARLRGVEDEVPFVPDHRTLDGVQLLTMETNSGWLDVHRGPDGAPAYEALRRHAERMSLGEFMVLVASLDHLAAMKRAAGRPLDLADLEEIDTIQRLATRANPGAGAAPRAASGSAPGGDRRTGPKTPPPGAAARGPDRRRR